MKPPIWSSMFVEVGAIKSARQKFALSDFDLSTCCLKKKSLDISTLFFSSKIAMSSPTEFAGQNPKTAFGLVSFSLVILLSIC